MLFNYPQELSYPFPTHQQYDQNIGRDLWQFPQTQTVNANFRSADNVCNNHEVVPQNPAQALLPGPLSSRDVIPITDSLNTIPDSKISSNDGLDDITSANYFKKTRRKNTAPKKRIKKEKVPKEKKIRVRNEDSWKRNCRKRAREKGDSYISVVGKPVPARSVKPVDCTSCMYKCSSHISEEERQELFKIYWDLETYKQRVDFLCDLVEEFLPLRPRRYKGNSESKSRRSFSRRYRIKIDDKIVRVCKDFFLSTLDIGDSMVSTSLKKKRTNPTAIQDLRGKKSPVNKTPEKVLRKLREHILSQIGLQGLLEKPVKEEVRNVEKLYKIYKADCELSNKKPVSNAMFRKVYAELHSGKNSTPVTLPPPEILNQVKKNSKRKNFIPLNKKSLKDCGNELSMPEEENVDNCSSSTEDFNMHSNPINPSQTSKSSANSLEFSGFDTNYNKDSESHISVPTLPLTQLCSQSSLPNYSAPYQSMPTYIQPSSSSQLILSHSKTTNRLESNFSPPVFPTVPNFLPAHLSKSQPVQGGSQSLQTEYEIAPFTLQTVNNSTSMSNGSQHKIFSDTKNRRSNLKTKSKRKLKSKKELKMRIRNEASWARNVRKNSRFSGEEYVSTRGQKVGAKKVQKVDCSKCMYKCQEKITEEQREEIHVKYWNLESFEERVAYFVKNVASFEPKRRRQGESRRAFSRTYSFDGVRVCKNFFLSTLDIGDSTVTTSLDKNRKGVEAIVDMRGKSTPKNKTPEETIQQICEFFIYLTGLRPHEDNSDKCLKYDITHLYAIYKYDSEVKGTHTAGISVFRNVLQKEFGITGASKVVKSKNTQELTDIDCGDKN